QFVAPLPDFSVKDLAGRAWSLPDLKGKATFLNFWATWCGPCRAEHPQIQKLHEIAKGRQDVQVLTIDVDANPTLVMTYMKEKGYTFPVIHAPALADRLFPYVGLPTNLLVNGKGWRTGMYPFRPGPEGAGLVLADLTEAATTR